MFTLGLTRITFQPRVTRCPPSGIWTAVTPVSAALSSPLSPSTFGGGVSHDGESEVPAADGASETTSAGEGDEQGIVGRPLVSAVTNGKWFKVEGPEGEPGPALRQVGSASLASEVAVGCGVGGRGR